MHTRLTGSKIRDSSVVLKYVKGNVETSHADVCGEVEVQSEEFLDLTYRGAGKSLARPGRKQARKHVRDARDFNNIETRAVIKFFFPARQGAEGNSRYSDRNISLFPSWSG